jgi:uncharacterized SAM-binding protein YcdF (DUF218 family)
LLLLFAVFFYLSKLLAFVLSPMVWGLALLLLAIFTKAEARRKKLVIASLLVLYICSNSFVVDECFRQYETVTQDHDSAQVVYEGAIVLGGLGDIDLRLGKINFGMAGDRLFQTLPLYYGGKIKRVIFTGGSGSIEFPEKREGVFVKKYLQSINFPEEALLVESSSRNTRENAVNTRRMLDSLNIKGRFLLVTSAFHMPRALAVFKKAGFTGIEPFITNKVSGIRRYTPDHLLVPNPGAIVGLQFLIHEWCGFLIYKFKGYA